MKPRASVNFHNEERFLCCPEPVFPDRKSRLRYWEIDHFFKCPVVGMCLTLDEQRQILKKAVSKIKKKSPFELHEYLVSSADTENRISRRIDSLLNRKLGKAAGRLRQLEPEAFVSRCLEDFRVGKYAAGLWATAVSPDLPVKYRKVVFGEIHMVMHWSGEQGIRMKHKLALKQAALEKECLGRKKAVRARRELEKENRALRAETAGLKVALAGEEKEKADLEKAVAGVDGAGRTTDLEMRVRHLEAALNAQRADNAQQQRRMSALKDENRLLSAKLERQQSASRCFQKEARDIVGNVLALGGCDATCPAFDLCKKRVLIVGGMTRMEALYRDLIEGRGGIFEYHDGYMKKGVKKLESSLKRADLVVCPVNCNSHGACSIVKNLAKKHNKTVHMLANSSLNAVTRVLADGDTGRGTINRAACRN